MCGRAADAADAGAAAAAVAGDAGAATAGAACAATAGDSPTEAEAPLADGGVSAGALAAGWIDPVQACPLLPLAGAGALAADAGAGALTAARGAAPGAALAGAAGVAGADACCTALAGARAGAGADACCGALAGAADADAGATADATACAAALAAAGADAEAGTEAGACATLPVASSGGTFSTAPTFMRLGSPRMKADGLASKIALAARASTAFSCDCVMAIATSFRDCPGFTVYCVAAGELAAAWAGAEAPAGWA
ncbi:hypothetical protein Busp01_21180 [Trinickia caryophylli]|nr:hypothetical protein Busp01_21180 [Trinickia caryophylli]